MKKFLGIVFLLAVSLPALAQWRLSIRDQQRFDSYYSRWQDYKQANNQHEITSMEKRMLDVYAHYGIPARTPFWRVATNGHPERVAWRERLNREERRHFDDMYARWLVARDHRNHFEMEKLEHHMREMLERNGIPREVRFEEVAAR